MQVSSLAQAMNFIKDIGSLSETMDDLTRQLASGKISETYSGLGSNASLVLSMRSDISEMSAYQDNISYTQIRVSTMVDVYSRVDEMGRSLQSDLLGAGYELLSDGRTLEQQMAGANFDELVALMNTELEGYLFSGEATSTAPVANSEEMLNGTVTQDGVSQYIAQYQEANLGASGLGRVTVNTTTDTVTLAEDADPSEFGFKLTGSSTDSAAVTLTDNGSSPPSYDIQFGAPQITSGELIELEFTLPDGTTETISLEATYSDPAAEGQFTIGADADATAANFDTALTAALTEEAATSLTAAAAIQGTDAYFDYTVNDVPLRVDGPPYASATGTVEATENDTVLWYTGGDPSSADNTTIVQIDDGTYVSYGSSAYEEAMRDMFKSTAVMAGTTFSEVDPYAEEAYNALSSRVASTLTFDSSTSPADLATELGLKSSRLDNTSARHANSITLAENLIGDAENIDEYEVAVMLTEVKTSLEASYSVTAMMQDMSLVNYI